MKWEPTVIGGLFLDEMDYKGILKYYYRIMNEHEAIEAARLAAEKAKKKRNK